MNEDDWIEIICLMKCQMYCSMKDLLRKKGKSEEFEKIISQKGGNQIILKGMNLSLRLIIQRNDQENKINNNLRLGAIERNRKETELEENHQKVISTKEQIITTEDPILQTMTYADGIELLNKTVQNNLLDYFLSEPLLVSPAGECGWSKL